MHIGQHIPLGQPVPDTVHAVCASLPTMADVIGYEEKKPETMAAVRFAYPRFVFHDYILQVTRLVAAHHGLAGRAVYAVGSAKAAWGLVNYVQAPEHSIFPEADFFIAHFPDSEEVQTRAKQFLQHTGVSISSRQAEDYLAHCDAQFAVQDEEGFQGDARPHVLGALDQYVDSPFKWLTNCGMNAFYAAICSTQAVQKPRGRNIYLQIGWLYLDTQRILERLLDDDDVLIVQYDVFDDAALKRIFAAHGDQLAAVVTELPTNPLVQSPDIGLLNSLCAQHGVVRIYDPSVAGIANVDVLPHCDILVSSLTKYTSWQGDVMIGLVALNEDSPFADQYKAAIPESIVSPYPRDLSRLAAQIDDMPEIVARQNANAIAVADYLQGHPAVKRVFHSRCEKSLTQFERIARSVCAGGAILTIELNKPLADFYDKATVVKGPSFGTHFTMMCPFMYLAHYDLVSTQEGRSFLGNHQLDPELIRLSVGAEPFDAIRRALAAGLD